MPDTTPTRTILLIDDDPEIRELVADVLTEAGYRVLTAAGGQPGLEQATAQQPDLILLDASLPDLDGVHVVQALQEDARTRGIPVVALTASVAPGPMMAAGALAFIPKPFSPQELVEIVAEIIRLTVGRQRRDV